MVTLEDISFSYTVRGVPAPVFEHFSATFERGRITAVIGPSGCGKTSLLRLIAGLQRPQSGSIRIDRRQKEGPSAGVGNAADRPRIGFIFQDFGLLPWLSVERNAGLGLEALGVRVAERRARAASILDELGLARWKSAYPVRLSGGMQQRVAVARALALDADLILMDEPFSSLDALTRESVQDSLREIQRAHHPTIIIVTHSIEEAVYLADDILILNGAMPARTGMALPNPHTWERVAEGRPTSFTENINSGIPATVPGKDISAHYPKTAAANGALPRKNEEEPADPREHEAYLEAVGRLRRAFDAAASRPHPASSMLQPENRAEHIIQESTGSERDLNAAPPLAPSIAKFIGKTAQILGAALFLCALWWIAAALLQKPFLPSPSLAFERFAQNLRSGTFLLHVIASARRVFLALLIAGPLAWLLGILAGRVRLFDNFFAPLVYLLHPLPKVAFLPILMLFLGLGDASKVALMGLVIFGQLFVTGRDASKSIPSALIDSVRVLGFPRMAIVRLVIAPSTAPSLMSALRVSLGTSIAVLFLSETFASVDGLGWYIMDAWSRIDYPDMYAAILALSLFGLILYLVIDAIEAYLLRWRQSS